MSNTLSIHEFGLYNIIKRSSSVLSFVMLGGAGIAVPRYLSFYLNQKRIYTSRNTIIATIIYIGILILFVSLTCILLREELAPLIMGKKHDFTSLVVVLLYSISLTCSSYIFAYLRGNGNFKLYNIVQMAFQCFMLVPLLFVRSDSAIVYFAIWSAIGISLCLFWTIRELCRTRYFLFRHVAIGKISSAFKEIVKYSSSRLVGDFFLFSLSAFPVIYLGKFSSMEFVSYYSVGTALTTMITPVFSFLGVILLPYVSRCMAENNLGKADVMIRKILYVDLGIAISLVSLFYILMPMIISVFFSGDYIIATSNARVQVLSVIPSVFYLLYRNPIDAVSVIPYNTIILCICFIMLVVSFHFSDNLQEYAWAYVSVTVFKGVSSFCVWNIIKRNKK